MYAIILDKNDNILVEHIEIDSDSDFETAVAKAKSCAVPVCIQWHRPSDGQMAYWSPRGASFKPHWYNQPGGAMPGSGAPEKPDYLKKKQVGVQLSKWVVDHLDELSGSRQANIEEAVIAHFNLNLPIAD